MAEKTSSAQARPAARSEFQPSSRQQWRSWLNDHHQQADEVWLVYFKKHTGEPTVSYTESVEEAICFGWIDGIKKKIDDRSYTHRFTPRRPGSKWSPRNVEMAQRMIEAGKMTPAGLEAFHQRESYDEAVLEARDAKELCLTPELEDALKAEEPAWKHFNALAPSYRKQYVGWLLSAKKEGTRKKRLSEAIALLSANKKLGIK